MGGISSATNFPRVSTILFAVLKPIQKCFWGVLVNFAEALISTICMAIVLLPEGKIGVLIAIDYISKAAESVKIIGTNAWQSFFGSFFSRVENKVFPVFITEILKVFFAFFGKDIIQIFSYDGTSSMLGWKIPLNIRIVGAWCLTVTVAN